MQDALYAQLLSMGFEPDQIEECQVAMAQNSPGAQFNLQAATEWWVGEGAGPGGGESKFLVMFSWTSLEIMLAEPMRLYFPRWLAVAQ